MIGSPAQAEIMEDAAREFKLSTKDQTIDEEQAAISNLPYNCASTSELRTFSATTLSRP